MFTESRWAPRFASWPAGETISNQRLRRVLGVPGLPADSARSSSVHTWAVPKEAVPAPCRHQGREVRVPPDKPSVAKITVRAAQNAAARAKSSHGWGGM